MTQKCWLQRRAIRDVGRIEAQDDVIDRFSTLALCAAVARMNVAPSSGSFVGRFRAVLHATRSRSSPVRPVARYAASARKLFPLLETAITSRWRRGRSTT